MIEYLPWSKDTNSTCLKKYQQGFFSALDIELGGGCNYHCIYCDSPDRGKQCTTSLEGIERLLSTGCVDWVYICGLGEPTFRTNYKKLISLLGFCKKYGARCSIFTNLSCLTPELVSYIREGVLCLLLKYDTFEGALAEELYGTKAVEEQLHNIQSAKNLVLCNGYTTNMAASIVPTKLNKNCIFQIVEECLSAQIYPLLGELESSGNGKANYERLCLSEEELLQIKEDIARFYGVEYAIPVCPSVISGIHFSYDSYITVDQFSGLSCHWFWLEEPKTKRLLRFSPETSLSEISEVVLGYRDTRLNSVKDFLAQANETGMTFGGCGGKANQIFNQYLTHHRGCN